MNGDPGAAVRCPEPTSKLSISGVLTRIPISLSPWVEQHVALRTRLELYLGRRFATTVPGRATDTLGDWAARRVARNMLGECVV